MGNVIKIKSMTLKQIDVQMNKVYDASFWDKHKGNEKVIFRDTLIARIDERIAAHKSMLQNKQVNKGPTELVIAELEILKGEL